MNEIKSKNKFCYSISCYFAFIYGQLNQTLQSAKERKIKKSPSILISKLAKKEQNRHLTGNYLFYVKKKLRELFSYRCCTKLGNFQYERLILTSHLTFPVNFTFGYRTVLGIMKI